jgi:hypothetical protein
MQFTRHAGVRDAAGVERAQQLDIYPTVEI